MVPHLTSTSIDNVTIVVGVEVECRANQHNTHANSSRHSHQSGKPKQTNRQPKSEEVESGPVDVVIHEDIEEEKIAEEDLLMTAFDIIVVAQAT